MRSMPEVRGGAALGIVGTQAARRDRPGLGPRHRLRFSLCCAKDGCRKRETPGSLRFLGRKVYFGAMVVLISAMQSGLNPARMKRLKELVGVSRRTVLRWRDWWRTVFTMSPFWRAHRGACAGGEQADLPASLLKSFDRRDPATTDIAVALPGSDHDGARDFAGNLTETTGPQKKQIARRRDTFYGAHTPTGRECVP